MRAGRIVDVGRPADLVDRYARRAMVRFSLPDPPAPLLQEIRRLGGVREVEGTGARITVHGDPRIIAHVGAAPVRWGSVPADLGVHVPGLEQALLVLVEHESAAGAPIPVESELNGGRQ